MLEVLKEIYDFCLEQGLIVKNFTYSPIRERKNLEFLILLGYLGGCITFDHIEDVAKQAAAQK